MASSSQPSSENPEIANIVACMLDAHGIGIAPSPPSAPKQEVTEVDTQVESHATAAVETTVPVKDDHIDDNKENHIINTDKKKGKKAVKSIYHVDVDDHDMKLFSDPRTHHLFALGLARKANRDTGNMSRHNTRDHLEDISGEIAGLGVLGSKKSDGQGIIEYTQEDVKRRQKANAMAIAAKEHENRIKVEREVMKPFLDPATSKAAREGRLFPMPDPVIAFHEGPLGQGSRERR